VRAARSRDISERHTFREPVCGFFEVHRFSLLSSKSLTDGLLSARLLTAGAKNKAGRISREEVTTSPDREPTRSSTIALPRAEGQDTRRRTMLRMTSAEPLVSPAPGDWVIAKRDQDWLVFDPAGELVCITVYQRGALEVVRRLQG
jgi:hypothetical protein